MCIATDGTEANGDSTHAVMSGDGWYVAFQCDATNWSANDTTQQLDIFLWKTIR